jgi:GNAT superfamily N-acetyltransferase
VVVIRPATDADLAEMAKIQFAAFWSIFNELVPGSHEHRGYRDRVIEAANANAINHWRDASVAVSGNDTLGVCYIIPDRRLLDGLWVKPPHQGQGTGGALIKDALKRFRKLSDAPVLIELHPNNPARRLYWRSGFVEHETTTVFSEGLQKDLPLLIMRRPFDS